MGGVPRPFGFGWLWFPHHTPVGQVLPVRSRRFTGMLSFLAIPAVVLRAGLTLYVVAVFRAPGPWEAQRAACVSAACYR